MTTTAIIMLVLFAFGGSFIQRVTGFGFGIFIMTVLPFLMPSYGEATALSGLLAIACALATGIRMFKYVPWKKLWLILAAFLVTSFFSIRFVSSVNDGIMKHVLGAILIAISIYFFFIGDRIKMKPNVPVQLSMGTLSGFMGGLFAMQGPPAVIYFLACTDTKEEYIGICQWYFIIGNIMMTFFRASNGFITPTVWRGWLIGIPAVMLGLLLGARVCNRMPIGVIRKCGYAYMALSGLLALLA